MTQGNLPLFLRMDASSSKDTPVVSIEDTLKAIKFWFNIHCNPTSKCYHSRQPKKRTLPVCLWLMALAHPKFHRFQGNEQDGQAWIWAQSCTAKVLSFCLKFRVMGLRGMALKQRMMSTTIPHSSSFALIAVSTLSKRYAVMQSAPMPAAIPATCGGSIDFRWVMTWIDR